jgi:hypothetical protein
LGPPGQLITRQKEGKSFMMLRTLISSPCSRHKLAKATVAAALVALGSSAILAGFSSASNRPAAAVALSSPGTVTARQIPPSSTRFFLQPGKIISSSDLGVRVFVNDHDGVALNSGMSLKGVTYPIATVNAGKTWRIDGPALHIPAANGPDAVTQVGAAGPTTYFVYGGPAGANSVDVSADGGKHWYRAYLGGAVGAVVDSNGELFAFTGTPGAYHSKDGGQVWHYSESFF